MIKANNPNQLNIFDPWDFLSPKRRQMLDSSWPGLFREYILPVIPVGEVAKHFHSSFGRPSKELYSMLGALILQQTFDLTDDETVEQFCFNLQWHYCLNITEESDSAKYMSPKTLWNNRNIIIKNELEDKIFNDPTGNLAHAFNVDTDPQRLDSVHIKSNMRRLGRISIFSQSIHKFLTNLKRGHANLFESIDERFIDKYLTPKGLGCFSRVKPSDSQKTLTEVSKDLFDLVCQFRGCEEVESMHSYKLLKRVLEDQCNLTSDDQPVELKTPKEIPSDSLQNPSDPDASYSGHKGQGYQVQVMETFCKDEQEKENSLNLITHVHIEGAHNSDADALIPAIEATEEQGLKPKQVTADTLYGSDENCEQAKEHGVELIAPVMGSARNEKLSLSDFEFSDQDQVVACPQGHAPERVNQRKKGCSIGFAPQHCRECPDRTRCPVQEGKKYFYLRFTEKDVRLMKRRAYEETDEFKDEYRWRAGVEATMSEYDRRTGVKHLRVRGLKAVKYCATLKALGINILRAAAFRMKEMMPQEELCRA